MATAVRIEWHMGDESSRCTSSSRPKKADPTRSTRSHTAAIYLFDQALAKVIATSEDVPLSDS
jgi:hypothetical protein